MSKKTIKSLSELGDLKNNLSQSESDELINELKKIWKITEASLIGNVVVNRKKEGKLLFVNVKTTNGERVKYPNNEDVVLEVPKNLEVKPNRKYKFSFKISQLKQRAQIKQPHLIIVDHSQNLELLEDEFYSITGKRFIKNLIKKNEADYLRNSDISGNQVRSLDLLLNEINKKPDTFVFELIQNADDYPNPNQANTDVKFTITRDHLALSHNGLEFSERNVKAISSIGSNDKKDQEDKIGFKGMGFKSIFKFSNHVWIKSGIYSFKFDENYYKRENLLNGNKNPKYCKHSMPWQILPIWTAPRLSNLEEKEQNLLKNSVCVFIRPNGKGILDRRTKLLDIEKMFLETFKNDDRILLFLRNVNKLEFQGKKSNFITILKKENWSISELGKLEIPTKIRERINLQSKSDIRIPEKYGIISSTEIKFATKKDGLQIQKTDNTKIFAYLPTDWNLGFDFLVNGNFIPDGSREELFHDIEWNLYLMEEAGRLFIKWISNMITKLGNSSPYKILPDINLIISLEENDKKLKFLERFKIGIKKGVLETSFVLDINNNLCLLDDIIIDRTGLSEIIGEAVFKEKLNINKNILHKDIKNKSWFNNQLSGTQVEIFDWDILKENIHELTSFLKDPITNIKFINCLISSDKMNEYKDIAIVLTETGKLAKASNIYINIKDEDLSFVNKLEVQLLDSDVKVGLSVDYESYFNVYDGCEFIKEEIIFKTDVINGMVENVEESKELFNHLLKYSNQFNQSDLSQLGNLKIYTVKDAELKINEANLYIYHHTIQKMIDTNCFPINHFEIISNKYTLELHEFLKTLGVKFYFPIDFIEKEICQYVDEINEHLNPLSNELKLKATQHLIELIITHKAWFSEEVTKYIYKSLKELKVVTKDNEFNPVSECFLSNEYTGNKEIEDLMVNFPEKSISFISPLYLNSSIDKKEWKKTLQVLKCSDDHLSFIKKKLLKRLPELDENQIINATKLIFKYHRKLEGELGELTFFPVLTNSGIIDIYDQIVFLGEEYYPELDKDIKNLIKNCLFNKIISNQYTSNKHDDWKEFWVFIGAHCKKEKIEIVEECFKYVHDKETTIDIQYDSILSWMKGHPNLSVSYLPTYIQKNLITPNLNNKLCYSHELFDYCLKDVIQDNDRVCSIDLSDETQIRDAIGLKTEIDIETYVLILKREETINWLNKNNIVTNIHKLLTEQSEDFPEDFIAKGKVMNQKKEWVPISELYSIEKEFSKKLEVKTSDFVIHKDFNDLSTLLEIEELIEEDFELIPIDIEKSDEIKSVLLERIKYIAFIKNHESYKDIEQQLIDAIDPFVFNKCKKLSLQYDNKIKKNDFPFWGDERELIIYYTGNWKQVTAANMFKWIFDLFDLSGEGVKRAFDRILLANNTEEIIEYLKEEYYDIPYEWHAKGTQEGEVNNETRQNEKLEEEIAQEKPHEKGDKSSDTYRVNYSDEEITYLKSVITGEIDFSKSDQFSINKNAVFRSILFLRDEGYSIPEEFTEDIFEHNEKPFIDVDGVITSFIIRSAVKGVLFLDPSSWEKLNKVNVSLLIYEGGEEVTRKDSKDSVIKDYADFNKFGLVRVGEDNGEIEATDFDNLLFERDKGFEADKYDNYKLIFLIKENDYTETFINIFKEVGGENDSK